MDNPSPTPIATDERPLPTAQDFLSMKHAWETAERAAWKARRVLDTSRAGLIWGFFACLFCTYSLFPVLRSTDSVVWAVLFVTVGPRLFLLIYGIMLALLFVTRDVRVVGDSVFCEPAEPEVSLTWKHFFLLLGAIMAAGIATDSFEFLSWQRLEMLWILGALAVLAWFILCWFLLRSVRKVTPLFLVVPVIIAPFIGLPFSVFYTSVMSSLASSSIGDEANPLPMLLIVSSTIAVAGVFFWRFLRLLFWEDLLFALSVLVAPWVGYRRFSIESVEYVSALPLLACIIGTACLYRRWKRWVKLLPVVETAAPGVQA